MSKNENFRNLLKLLKQFSRKLIFRYVLPQKFCNLFIFFLYSLSIRDDWAKARRQPQGCGPAKSFRNQRIWAARTLAADTETRIGVVLLDVAECLPKRKMLWGQTTVLALIPERVLVFIILLPVPLTQLQRGLLRGCITILPGITGIIIILRVLEVVLRNTVSLFSIKKIVLQVHIQARIQVSIVLQATTKSVLYPQSKFCVCSVQIVSRIRK